MNQHSFVSDKEYQNTILRHRERAYEYLDELNGYLKQGDMAGIEAFLAIFQDEQFRKIYIPCLEQIAYAYIFAAITIDELNAGIDSLLIKHGKSIEELKFFLKRIEFLLWEMEFGIVSDAEQRCYEFIERYQISAEALKGIITVAGMNKKHCYMILSCAYLEHQNIKTAFKILLYGAEQFPKDIELLTMLIQLCRNLGMSSLAESYEEKLEWIKQ